MTLLTVRSALASSLCRRSFSQAKSSGSEVNINVGTIGHVDHGKTTLSSAITKVSNKLHPKLTKYLEFGSIDKAKEETIRGITINASHIGYYGISKNRHYSHTDCPGHADFIKNMICGASQMDAAILVVAATEGSMPQTREHLLLSKQIGIKNIITYINKCDLADEEMKILAEMEIRDQLNSYGWNGDEAKVIFGSALAALNGLDDELGEKSILKLLQTLDETIQPPERDISSPFLMYIDSKISIPGRGTAVIGTVSRGTLKRLDAIEIVGFDDKIKSVITDIHMFGKSFAECSSGDHVSLLIRGIKVHDLRRGMAVCAAGSVEPSNRFEANMYFLPREESGLRKAVTKNYINTCIAHTWSLGCRVDIPTSVGGLVLPGDSSTAHLSLPKSMPLFPGDSFTVISFHLFTLALSL